MEIISVHEEVGLATDSKAALEQIISVDISLLQIHITYIRQQIHDKQTAV